MYKGIRNAQWTPQKQHASIVLSYYYFFLTAFKFKQNHYTLVQYEEALKNVHYSAQAHTHAYNMHTIYVLVIHLLVWDTMHIQIEAWGQVLYMRRITH